MALRFKVNSLSSKSQVFRLPGTTTWGTLRAELVAKCGLASPIVLNTRVGSHQVANADTAESATLSEIGIENGNQYDASGASVDSSSGNAAAAAGTGAAAAASGGASAGSATAGLAAAGAGSGGMKRVIVPADNTCLFTAVGYLLMGGSKSLGPELRALCVSKVQTTSFPEGALDGKTPAEYARWLSESSRWGGAIELGLLAAHFGVQLVCIEVRTGRPYRFGSGAQCAYVVNDGIHYDALARDDGAPGGEAAYSTTFPASDEEALAGALAVCEEMKKARAFVDTSSFALLCTVCNKPLKGQKEALEHAKATSHTNFVQNA
jgi:ubiquitin thioesterase OTU1